MISIGENHEQKTSQGQPRQNDRRRMHYFAEYLNIDPTIVRLIWVLLSMCYGGGVLLYIIAMIIMPREDYLP